METLEQRNFENNCKKYSARDYIESVDEHVINLFH